MSKEFYTGLIYKALINDISVADQDLLDSWLEDQEHAQYASEIRKSWELAEGYGEVSELDLGEEFDEVQRKIHLVGHNVQGTKEFSLKRWMAIAASVLILLTLGYFWRSGTDAQEWQTYVGTSELSTTLLEDGSEVWLKEGSTIIVPKSFGADSREIRMQGSAMFQVKHDASRPFTVRTENELVRVLGTRFHIEEADEQTSIQLLEGKVRVSQLDGKLMSVLDPGQRLISHPESDSFSIEDELHENEFAWQSNKLVFRSQKLGAVITDVASHFEVDVVLEKGEMANCLATATFENKEIEEVIATIATIFDLTIVQEDKTYHLKGGECR